MERKTQAATAVITVLALAGILLLNEKPSKASGNVNLVAEDLDVPWGIEFLPGGDMLINERPGTLLRIGENSGNFTETYEVEGVEHTGEGGLLGVEKHPNFTKNNQIYLYMTKREGDILRNRVVRYSLQGEQLSEPETIISGLPGAVYHDGGRMEFGPDGKLYITAGDATNPGWAQERNRLAGKILRLNPDGTIPGDNPFNSSVYSYGHRNPQGLAWIGNQLWATEHGNSQHDELNRILKGGNYGWPVIEADQKVEGMIRPEIYAEGTTWAPAGAAYTNGSIYFAGLRGETLYEAKIQDGTVQQLLKHWEGRFGRLRAVERGPDGDLYVSTSNTDGRGLASGNDDRIVKVDPSEL
jgi:glucose/arabinose dehydrogenase